jgi:hypothetical protein
MAARQTVSALSTVSSVRWQWPIGQYSQVADRRKRPEGATPDTLFEPSKVDLVALSWDGSIVSLYIVSDSEWSGTDAQIESPQRKIHNYVSFAIDGSMTAAYPEAKGLAWQIVIDCQRGLPDERIRAVLSQVGQAVTRYGGNLVVQ